MPNIYISYKLNIGNKEKKRVKRVNIPGKLKNWEIGRFATRMGAIKNGVKITYVNPIRGGTGREGRIKKMLVKKIIPLPRSSYSVKVSKHR